MTGRPLSDTDLRLVGWIVSDYLDQRARGGVPIPPALRHLQHRLTCALSDNGHQTSPPPTESASIGFVTTSEYAAAHGITERTARRHAQRVGVKRGGRWLIPT